MVTRWGVPAITAVALAAALVLWRTVGRAWPAGGADQAFDNLMWITPTIFVLAAPVVNAVSGPHRLRDLHGWVVLAVALASSFAMFYGGYLFLAGMDAADGLRPEVPGAAFWLAWEALGLLLLIAAYALATTFVILRATRYRSQPATPVVVVSNPA